MKRFLFLLAVTLVWASPSASFAQRPQIAQLQAQLQQEMSDSARSNTLSSLSYAYYQINPDSGILHGKEALQIARDISSVSLEAVALNVLGINHFIKSDYEIALDYYMGAVESMKKLGNSKQAASGLQNIGNIHYRRGDFEKAMEVNKQVLAIREQAGDTLGIAYSQVSLGMLCDKVGEPTQAIDYYRQALKVLQTVNDTPKIATVLLNLGSVYSNQGNQVEGLAYLQQALDLAEQQGNLNLRAKALGNIGTVHSIQKDYDKALEYCKKVLAIEKQVGDQDGMVSSYLEIGNINLRQADTAQALENLRISLRIAQGIGDKIGYAEVYLSVGAIHLVRAQYDSADYWFERALDIAREAGNSRREGTALNNLASSALKQNNPKKAYSLSKKAFEIAQALESQSSIQSSARSLHKAASALGLYREAYEAHVAFKAAADSLFNAEQTKKFTRLGAEYEFKQEKKLLEQERDQERAIDAAKLQSQRRFTIAVGAGLVVALVLAFLAFRQAALRKAANRHLALQKRRVSERNEELKVTLDRLREAQMQLVESEKMASLGQLTAGVAHEINNPVNFVSANVAPLRLDIEDLRTLLERYRSLHGADDNYRDTLREIAELEREIEPEQLFEEVDSLLEGIAIGAGRTKEIVNGLRAFSRHGDSERKPVSLHDSIEATLVILRHQVGQQGVEIVKDFGNLTHIEALPGKLNQVFMNLFNNALQALEEQKGGRIEIVTRQLDSDTVQLRVLDNGPGFPEEASGRLFEPFFTTKPVGKGTGLGLSVAYGIVGQHQGCIEAFNRPEGGAEFVIELPVRYEAAQVSPLKEAKVDA